MQKAGFMMSLIHVFSFLGFYIIGFFLFWIQNTFWDAMAFLIIFGFGFTFITLAAEYVSSVLPRVFCYFCAMFVTMFFCFGIPSMSSDLAGKRAAGLIAEYPDDEKYKNLWKQMERNNSWQTLDDVKAAQKGK